MKKSDGQLRAFVERFRPELGRRERRHWCGMYLRGLLLDGERKSIEPMAGRLEGGNEQALQQFVNQSPWEAQAVAESLCDYMIDQLKIKQAVLVLDDTMRRAPNQRQKGMRFFHAENWPVLPGL